jgi:queuosine precursor transporter
MTGLATPLLIALYVACELIANVTAGRVVDVWGFTAPGGVFIYALTFTLVDLLNERMGKAGARHVVVAAFAANLLLALYVTLVLALPSPSFFLDGRAYATALGGTPRIIGASLTAYIISSMLDVEVFALWREKVGGPPWMRVLVSNSVSTGLDSVIFVAMAFAGSLPLTGLIAGQYAIKMAMTFLSLPLIYAAAPLRPVSR